MNNLIPSIIDVYDNYHRKHISNIDYDYQMNLYKAFDNNKKLGLNIPNFTFDKNISILEGNKVNSEILEKIHNKVFIHSSELLAFNCFIFSYETQQILLNHFGINSLLTLGSVSDSGKKIFYESFLKLKYRLENKEYISKGVNLHSWLTLPDYSVIDVTILSALKSFNQFPDIDYRQFSYLETNKQGKEIRFNYHPILVGSDYLNNINIRPYIKKI